MALDFGGILQGWTSPGIDVVKNELLLVLWQLSMSGFSLKLFVCCSIPVMMFVISYMHDYAYYVSCILVHNLYQLIQTNLTWAAQC